MVHKVAFDITLMKPACVLVAAGMGADTDVATRFNTKHWLLTPTEDMKVYNTTEEQLQQLIKKVEQVHG